MKSINRNQLFVASCLALLVTSLSFGIRAGILNRLGVQFNLTAEMANTLNEAKKAAGPEIINATLIIPVMLIIAFIILNLYMRNRNRKVLQAA